MKKPDTHSQTLASPNPRRAAFRVVSAVLDKGTPLDEAMEKAFAAAPDWDARDRAFLRSLAATLFRRLAALNWAITSFLTKRLPPKAMWVMHWLRIGAVQILFMNVADHAAVNTTVTNAAKEQQPGAVAYKRLVNAILRNITRKKTEILNDIEKDPAKNVPKWLFGRWQRAYGREAAKGIVRSHLKPPPLDVTLKDPNKPTKLKGEKIFAGTLRLKAEGRIEELPGFREGDWWAQDLAASLPPRLMGDVSGQNVLDLCAAPGGKTLYMASRGAKVTAVDISKVRLGRVKDNLKRTGLSANVVAADVLAFKPGAPFKYILLDAPCSATGTMRRHPDVPYNRYEKDILRLAGIQARMLAHVFSLLEPGGTLVYCVCSLEPEEGEQIITSFLQKTKHANRVPIDPKELEGHKEWITKDGDLRTLPNYLKDKGGMDGFFASRITKT